MFINVLRDAIVHSKYLSLLTMSKSAESVKSPEDCNLLQSNISCMKLNISKVRAVSRATNMLIYDY
jgi:hypothetical protein